MSSPNPLAETETFGEEMFNKGKIQAVLEMQIFLQEKLNELESKDEQARTQ